MLKAGNVGGEILNWIAMLGAIGNRKPNYVAPQMQNGHAYGVWRELELKHRIGRIERQAEFRCGRNFPPARPSS